MKQSQVSNIIVKKRKRIAQVMNMKQQYKVAVFQGLLNGDSVKKIHQHLYDITMNFKLAGIQPSNELYKVAKILARQAKKQTYEEDGVIFPLFPFYGTVKKPVYKENGAVNISKSTTSAETILNFYSHVDVENVMNRVATDEGRAIEEKEKKEVIKAFEKEAKNLHQIFFMASKHDDCAADHLDYQGKIYVMEKWKSKIEKKHHKRIQEFIDENKILTFEEIIAKPVWLITRPNCRHYFQSIKTEDAMTGSLKGLLEKYDLSHKVGERNNMQTFSKGKRNKSKDTIADIKTMIYRYRERLSFHQQVYKMDKTNLFIKKAIQKDKLLLKKWKKML